MAKNANKKKHYKELNIVKKIDLLATRGGSRSQGADQN